MSSSWVLASMAGVAILWSLLPIVRHDAWWIRGFEFPRLQVTVITGVILVTYIAVEGLNTLADILLCMGLSACILFQLIRIAPYTPMHSKQLLATARPDGGSTLSLLVANVLTPNRNADALLRLINEKQPDIVLTVETDTWWESALNELESGYPHTVKYPLDNLYGMHLFSKLELIAPEVRFLVEEDVPSIHTGVKMQSGRSIDLYCLHPAPPSPTENPTASERDAELLIVARLIGERARPAMVVGDLNDVAWSGTTRLFQKISGLLDPRIGRGMFNTYHAKYPWLRWPLDHVFVSSDFALVCFERLPAFGSDHFPIFATLSHMPAVEELHDEPVAEDEDVKRAREKIKKVAATDRHPGIEIVVG